MSRKHNFGLAALLGLGVAVLAIFGSAVVKQSRQNQTSKNPFEGITRPQFFSESPFEGEDQAGLALFEYGDFACPACREMQSVMERVFAKYGDKIFHIWKDFPVHGESSKKIAIAARCAAKESKFWQYHDWIFSNKAKPGDLDLIQGAKVLSLDEEKFAGCLEEEKIAKLVERDFLEGQALGVDLVPFFVIGDRAFGGAVSFEDFESVILEELGKP